MANSGKIQGTTKNGDGSNITAKYGTWISWVINSASISANTTNVTISICTQRIDGYTGTTAYNNVEKPTVTLKVGGVSKTPQTINYMDTRNKKVCTLATWTGDVTHNADGKLTLALYCYWDAHNDHLKSGTISGSAELDAIPRYATSVQSVNSRAEKAIKMNWSSDSTIDYVKYSTDWGTTWIDVGSVNAKSGSYTIMKPSSGGTALAPNTTYNIITRLRRKDSQLWTNSEKLSVTTYDYPYCNSTPDVVIGNALTLGFYNPLGRTFLWTLLGADGSIIAQTTSNGTSYKGINGSGSVANFYKSIPNAKSGRYKVKVTYGTNVSEVNGGTYSIRGNEIPTINALSYADSNTTTINLTNDNKKIVQNQSEVKVTFGSATPNYSAGSIKSYKIECNGNTSTYTTAGTYDIGTIDSNTDVDLTLTATDSRGLSASKTIKVSMIAYKPPTAKVTLERVNNYEDETHLTVDVDYTNINGNNKVTIAYDVVEREGDWDDLTPIDNNETITLQLDKNKTHIIYITYKDALNLWEEENYHLNKGVFPLFIDTVKNSVGINCFPKNENSLEVNDLDITTIYSHTQKMKLNANEWTDTGISYDKLATGTYVMQVVLNHNSSATSNQFGERISGIMSWYALPTNGSDADLIPVSKAGHTRNGHNIQLRILRTPNPQNSGAGILKLQISDTVAWNGEADVVFYFKRLI